MTFTIDARHSLTATSGTPGNLAGMASWNRAGGIVPGFPVLMRSDQVYYWTSRWQEDEAESWADLRNGDFVEYDSPLDAVRGMHRVD